MAVPSKIAAKGLLLLKYVQAALRDAQYETIEEDSSIFATIPGFDGLWATAPTQEAAEKELAPVLEGWILVGIAHHHPLPIIGGIDLNVREVA
jgi:hypothetical protein